MTELMKRYEAETGCDSTTIWRGECLASDDYIAWLETKVEDEKRRYQQLDEMYIVVSRAEVNQRKEAEKLKAQLTWRPVSEKPEKDCQCFVSLADGGMVIIGMWKSGDLCIEEKYKWLGVKSWLPIPPAPEGE